MSSRPERTRTTATGPSPALDDNPVAFLRNLGRARHVHLTATSSYARLSSDLPIPILSSVFAVRFSNPAEVADTARTFRPGPVLWWIGPSARPADVGRLLERYGLHRTEVLTLMTADLRALPPALPIDGLRMEAVRNPGAVRGWAHVQARARDRPAAVEAAWVSVLSSLGTGPEAPLQHYLATSGDGRRPLASASIFLDGRWAGLYSLGTVPSARGRGIGTAVMLFALADARARGYRTAVLGAEPAATGLYRRSGFTDGAPLEVYT